MSCGEYNLPTYRGNFIAEDNSEKWKVNVNVNNTIPLRRIPLEDEIRLLRNRMERIFMEEKSFTADIVVEISSLLDLKLNEYMRIRNKDK
jgi:hypothetical protein